MTTPPTASTVDPGAVVLSNAKRKESPMILPTRLSLACAVLALGGLSASSQVALGAGAETITLVERQLDVNPGETNPCTGATGTIRDDEQDVFHITTLADGSTDLSGHSTVDVAFIPDDASEVAYVGHETFAFSETSRKATDVMTIATQVRVRGTDGTFLTAREVGHVTAGPTGVVVSFDRPTFVCS
jgi:hypothetical protein